MAERKTCSNKGCEKKFTAKTNNQIYYIFLHTVNKPYFSQFYF